MVGFVPVAAEVVHGVEAAVCYRRATVFHQRCRKGPRHQEMFVYKSDNISSRKFAQSPGLLSRLFITGVATCIGKPGKEKEQIAAIPSIAPAAAATWLGTAARDDEGKCVRSGCGFAIKAPQCRSEAEA
jgi:hypothetical protein